MRVFCIFCSSTVIVEEALTSLNIRELLCWSNLLYICPCINVEMLLFKSKSYIDSLFESVIEDGC